MTGMFLDPGKPLATCLANTCEGCAVADRVHCHFAPRDLVTFLATSVPPFFIGGAGVFLVGAWWLAPWAVMILAYFGLAEIRVMCSHCPHYAEPGKTLQCWANYGSPRLWKYRPGPMSTAEKVVFLGGFALVWGYALAFLLAGSAWLLLAMYLLTSVTFSTVLRRFYCSQCMNFACPLNTVDDRVRATFRARNPRTWAADGS
jgi:hypothetical protein